MPWFFLQLRRLACCLLLLSPGVSGAATLDAAFSSATHIPLSTAEYIATGNTVNLSLGFAPQVGTALTVVQVSGLAPIEGRFSNLADGQQVNLEFGGIAYPFVANYTGGTGNDLTLDWGNTKTFAWGKSGYSNTGATGGSNFLPAPLDTSGILSGRKIRKLAPGTSHVIALDTQGGLAGWGSNIYGQLGIEGISPGNTPVEIPLNGVLAGKNIVDLAAGETHSLALCSDGTLVAWGANNYGQRGNGIFTTGPTTTISPPTLVDRSGVLAGKTVVAVAAGSHFSLALCLDGTVAAWGRNNAGQLGNGTTADSSVPVAVSRTSALAAKRPMAIAAGSQFTVILCDDGTVATCGYNATSELGDNTTQSRSTPVSVVATGVLAGKKVIGIAAGESHVLSLLSDGSLAAWGRNSTGVLGDGNNGMSPVPVLVDRSGVLAGRQVVEIAAGGLNSLALCSDGSLAIWGSNQYGQIGEDTSSPRRLPVLVGTSTLTAGSRFVRPVRLGDGGDIFALVALHPAPSIETLPAATGDAGAVLNAGLRPNGSETRAWFEFGLTPLLGNKRDAEPSSFTGGGLQPVSLSLAGLTPGTTYHYRAACSGPGGTSFGEIRTFTTTTRATLASLSPSTGVMGPDFDPQSTAYWMTVPAPTASIAFTPATAEPGATISIAGSSVASGQPGPPIPLANGNTPVEITVTGADGNTLVYQVTVTRIPEAISLSAGNAPPLRVAGFHASGSLNISLGFAPPTGTDLMLVDNEGRGFIRGAFDNLPQGGLVRLGHAGLLYEFAVNYHGGDGNDLVLQWTNVRAFGWGKNQFGQVGGETQSSILSPVPVVDGSGILEGKTISSISCGLFHTVALCTDGTVVSWGANDRGQLGNGSTDPSNFPVAVDLGGDLAGKTVVAVSAGDYHCLALCADGTIAGWGWNSAGQLGSWETPLSTTPVLLPKAGALEGRKVVSIRSGGSFNLALSEDGKVSAWGDNSRGQLGDGTLINRLVPVLSGNESILEGRAVRSLAAGSNHVVAVCDDGTLVSWGANAFGSLGDGTTIDRPRPVPVATDGLLAGKRVIAVACGGSHSLALCADNTLASWGWNSSGRLGNGTTTNSSVPVAVTQSGVLAGKEILEISCSFSSSFAFCSDGSIGAWGFNVGELGDGTNTSRSLPVLVATSGLGNGNRFIRISSKGSSHNLGLVASQATATIETLAAEPAGDTAARLNASVHAHASEVTVTFEYGTTPGFGLTASAVPLQVAAGTAATVHADLTGLKGGTTYHYRAIASGPSGISYGKSRSFTTGNEAALATLVLDGGQLIPSFSSLTRDYVATVPFETDRITVTAGTISPSAMVTIQGSAPEAGNAAAEIGLSTGSNRIEIEVRAVASAPPRHYTITVVRYPDTVVYRHGAERPLILEQFPLEGNAPALELAFAPATGTALTLVEQTGPSPFGSRFDDLAQGQSVVLTHEGLSYRFIANYFGGDGNDLTLEWAARRIVGWGTNLKGQLGNGSFVGTLLPVATGTGVFPDGCPPLQIESSSTGNHTLALGSDGAVYAWGDGALGQRGNGYDLSDSKVVVAVDRSGILAGKTVIRVAAGGNHSLALCEDGTLVAWGSGSSGQLGRGSTGNSPVPAAVDQTGILAGKTIIAIAAGPTVSLAACSDGTVASWGTGPTGTGSSSTTYLKPVAVFRGGVLKHRTVVALAAGAGSCYALCSDGSLVAWGSNSSGSLGIGTTVSSSTPVLVRMQGSLAGKSAIRVTAGAGHGLALFDEGTLATWGNEVGSPSVLLNQLPVDITNRGALAGESVVSVDAGHSNGIAVCSDGTLAAWGSNVSGQLGNNGKVDSVDPVTVLPGVILPGERVIGASGGFGFHAVLVAIPTEPAVETLAAVPVSDTKARLTGSVTSDGSGTTVGFEYGPSVAYGDYLPATTPVIQVAGATGFGAEVSGLRPGTTYHYRAIARNVAGTFVGQDRTFTTGSLSTLAGLSLDRGSLSPGFSPGETSYTVTLPAGVPSIVLTPVATTATAAITLDGSPVASGAATPPLVISAGENRFSLTVQAPGADPLVYTIRVTRLPEIFAFASPGNTATEASSFNLAGLEASFSLAYHPARGSSLQVLENTGSDPIRGRFSNLRQGESIHLDHDGISYLFVANYHGGDGNDLVLQWANLRLVGWGSNGTGQLGNGVSSFATVPSDLELNVILDGVPLLASATGAQYSLVLTSDGEIHTWGDNSYGQLGRNAISGDPAPESVDQSGVLAGREVIAIAAGTYHSLAVCADGKVASWGRNTSGELGAAGISSRSLPVLVDDTGALAGKRVMRISCGGSHSLALCSDGTLVSWGLNTSGQLGNNRDVNSSVPVRVDNSGVLAGKRVTHIAAGKDFSMVLCSDGTLAGWGSNANGQLGINSSDTFKPVPVPILMNGALTGKTVTSIAAGGAHCVALCSDGSAVAWGDNTNGALGDGTTTRRLAPVTVSRGGIPAGIKIAAVTAGDGFSVALTASRTAYAWGNNNRGQLGIGTTVQATVPTAVQNTGPFQGENFISAVSGSASSCTLALISQPPLPQVKNLPVEAITASGATLNGRVLPNGNQVAISFEYGLTPDYGTRVEAMPSSAGGKDPVTASATLHGLVSGATYHYRINATTPLMTVFTTEGTFTTPADASLANLSLDAGTLQPEFSPSRLDYWATLPPSASSIQIAATPARAGATVSINGNSSGSVAVPPGNSTVTVVVTAPSGTPSQSYRIHLTRLPEAVRFNSADDVPVSSPRLAPTGRSVHFALGFAPSPGTRLTVVENTGTGWIDGEFANLAQGQTVNLDFEGRTYRFAANYFGGDGNDLVLEWALNRLFSWGLVDPASLLPAPAARSGPVSRTPIIEVAGGQHHRVILLADGSVLASGGNVNGQLGNGTDTYTNLPVSVDRSGVLKDKQVIRVAAGRTHSLAVCSDGTVATWGSSFNLDGSLLGPAATSSSEYSPILVPIQHLAPGKAVVGVAAGIQSSFAWFEDGTIAAWGSNSYAHLGNNSVNGSSNPVRVYSDGVLAGKRVISVAAGEYHVAALCSDGTVACWGRGDNGQLGNNSTAHRAIPVAVSTAGILSGKTVVQLAAGKNFTLALCSDGTIAGWGAGNQGQLGTGSLNLNNPVPVAVDQSGVLAGKTVTGIAAGEAHAWAVCSDGSIAAWGRGNEGQLGIGSLTNQARPVLASPASLLPGERFTRVAPASLANSSHALAALEGFPLMTDLKADPVGNSTATLSGIIHPDGLTGTVHFEYGTDDTFVFSVQASPPSASGIGDFRASAQISGLRPGTTYRFRIRFVTGQGTHLSDEQTFTTATDATLASLETSEGPLSPGFHPATTRHALSVPSGTSSITLLAIPTAPGASVTVNGFPSSTPLALSPGPNELLVEVTAPGSGETFRYLVIVTRLPEVLRFDSPSDAPLVVREFAAALPLPRLELGFTPLPGTRLTLIRNTGGSPLHGRFPGLPQGGSIDIEHGGTAYRFLANYHGGDGNDLVLQWANSRLFGWGENATAQLGNGYRDASSVPTLAGVGGPLTSDPVLVAGPGGLHSLALSPAGTLAAWGSGLKGVLGIGSSPTDTPVPAAVYTAGALRGKNVVAIRPGRDFTMVLCDDGTLAAWGSNAAGQLGLDRNGSYSAPQLVPPRGALAGRSVASVATGRDFTLALCTDGTLVAWGLNTSGQLGNNGLPAINIPVPVVRDGVLSGKTVSAITTGASHSLVLCEDGSLFAWGLNADGQLGDGSNVNRMSPVAVDRSGILAGKQVIAIAAGDQQSFALCSDGTVAAWGLNANGQLGDNTLINRSRPVAVDVSGILSGRSVVSLTAGADHTLAACSDGTLVGWGRNHRGQLADGTLTDRPYPVEVSTLTLRQGERFMPVPASHGGTHTVMLAGAPLADATTLAARDITGTAATLAGSVQANRNAVNVSFEYGLDATYGESTAALPANASGIGTTSASARISGLKPSTTYHFRIVVEGTGGIVRGEDRTFTTLSDNALLSALTVSEGVIGPDFDPQVSTYHVSVPAGTGSVTVNPVTAHPRATSEVQGATAGSVALTGERTTVTITVTAEDRETLKDYTLIVTRLPATFVLGDDAGAPLVVDGFSARGFPAVLRLNHAPVPGSIFTVVRNTGLGFIHGTFSNLARGQRVALVFDGLEYDFVANYHGGDGNDLVLQWANTRAFAWGLNSRGQLGDGTTTRRLSAIATDESGVLAGKTVTAITGGSLHSLALCSDGSVAAWGYNSRGQLGNGSTTDRSKPVAVDFSDAAGEVVAISAGAFHSLALRADGRIAAWGYNNHGQLGTGNKVTYLRPVLVPAAGALAGKQVVAVAAGSFQSFALCADGTVAAWGRNDAGELGDGTTTSASLPVSVDRSGILAGKTVASIAAGQDHLLALCTDGTLVAWGDNRRGKLGNGTTLDAPSPVAVDISGLLSGKSVVELAAGDSHSLVRCSDGTVAAWGSNQRFQLGNGSTLASRVPVAVNFSTIPAGKTLASVSAGRNHNLARFRDGTLAAWGENTNGQLGNLSTTAASRPIMVNLSATPPGSRAMFDASGPDAQHSLAVLGLPGSRPAAGPSALAAVVEEGETDTDRDGVPDLLELAFGLDPSVPHDGTLPVPQLIDGTLGVSFTEPAGVSSFLYGAECSESLEPGTWKALPDTGSGTWHEFKLPVGSAPRMFMRLTVQPAAR